MDKSSSAIANGSPASGMGKNNKVSSRTSMTGEGTPSRRSRGETPVNGGVLNPLTGTELLEDVAGGTKANRFSMMKKTAEEQRRKVREIRTKMQEDERTALAQRKQEELRLQIRGVLDNILVDVRKDILLILQERLNQERHNLKADLKRDMEKTEEVLCIEIEKRLTNGEPFDIRIARIQKDFEDSFNKILKSELGRVQREILQDVDQRIDKEKQRWEDNFRREADTRVRTAEENIRSDFRNGLEDAQRQCADIIKTTQDRTTNMENSLTEKIEVLDHTNATRVQDCENNLVRLIDNTMKERDVKLAQNFKLETDRMRQEIVDIRGDLNQLSSKCCTIL